MAVRLRGRNFHVQSARAECFDDQTVLILDLAAQVFRRKFRGSGKFFVVRGFTVQNAATLVDQRVNGGMIGTTVLGLDVKNVLADFDVGVIRTGFLRLFAPNRNDRTK
jgi:hypothetical protein